MPKEVDSVSKARDSGIDTHNHSRSSSRGFRDDSPLLLPLKQKDAEETDDGYREASFASAVFNLSTTIVGAGIMALPATMKVLGLPLGLLTIVAAGVFSNVSMEFLNRYSKPCKARSYGSLMADSFGKPGKNVTHLSVIVNNLGSLIVYMIIIGDVLSGTADHTGVLEEWAGGPTWWNGRAFILFAITLLILGPLSSLRHVDSLKHSSALSMTLAGVFLLITMAVAVLKLVEGKIEAPRLLPAVYDVQSFWRVFTVVPVMVTAYICHHNLHPISSELKGSLADRMQDISRAAITLCATIYVATALFGYLLFGENTSSDILSNFDIDLGVPYSKLIGATVRITYAVHIMLVFPLLNFSLRLSLNSYLFPKTRPLAEDTCRFTLLTVVLLVLVYFGSILVPNICIVIEFTGATVSVCLAFIFPGALALRDASGIATEKDKWLAATIVILAVASSISAITTNIIDLFN